MINRRIELDKTHFLGGRPQVKCQVVNTRVNVSNYQSATELLTDWARSREHRYVCVAPVHPIMEAFDSSAYQSILNGADFVTADGMPVVWTQKILGHRQAQRVYGPDLTLSLCKASEAKGIKVGFYGGSEDAIESMCQRLTRLYPNLQISYRYSPPFRELNETEEEKIISDIIASDCQLLFIGLGTPKQDLWMARHKQRLPMVQVGVGAAFDFISGTKKQAPAWLQRIGLEWLFRLCSEPRRLWARYAWHNPRFVLLITSQILKRRFLAAKLF